MSDGMIIDRPPVLRPRMHGALLSTLLLLLALLCGPALAQTSQPRTVNFPSADGKTTLVGYLFAPAGRPKTAPAVVLMHGRSGAYSSLAKGNYSSVTLSKNIRGWAEFWTQQGYWALVVDSFGPRGYPAGFAAGEEKGSAAGDMRPLDAYGALRYLRDSPRVQPDRIALEGWSNGGSAVLAAMSRQALPAPGIPSGHGFRAAIALYPGCAQEERAKPGYVPYAPVRIFIGARNEEVSALACQRLAAAAKVAGGDVAAVVFEGATYDFDDPVREHQAVLPANSTATSETRQQALTLFAAALGR